MPAMWTEIKRGIEMSEDEMFEMIKESFEKRDRDKMVEFISALIARLGINGISCSCGFEPRFIEGVSEDGCYIEREYAKYEKSPIRDTLTVNFHKHDEAVRAELRREFLRKIPSPRCLSEVSK